MDEKNIQVQQKREIESPGEMTREGSFFLPMVDIFEEKDNIVLLADMPGVTKENVEIHLEENQLKIQGKVENQTVGDYLLSEYSIGDYMRTFNLSNAIDQSAIKASMKNGVLRVVLPKSEVSKPRKIEVKTN